LLALGLFGSGLVLPAAMDAASLEIKGDSARLVYISGKVQVQRDGTNTWRSAYRNRLLGGGDKVRTLSRALAEIALPGGSILRVAPYTEVQIKPPGLGEEVVTTIKVPHLAPPVENSVSCIP